MALATEAAVTNQVIEVCLFRNEKDIEPKYRALTWDELAKQLTTHVERRNKDGWLWSPTSYRKGATRNAEGVATVTAAVGDFDKGITYEQVKERLCKYEYAAHSTWRHTRDAPRFRVVIPFVQPIQADIWRDVKARIDEHVFGMATDAATKDACRIYYTPSCPPKAARFAEHHHGEWLDPLLLPPSTGSVATASTPRNGTGDATAPKVPLGKAALDFVANGAPLGEQRTRALAAGRNYLSAGYSVEDTAQAIWRGLQASPQDPDREPWTYGDAKQIASDLADKTAPPLEAQQPLPPRCEMHRVGMGYLVNFPSQGVAVTVDRLRRSGDSLSGELLMEAAIPLVPRQLFWGRVSLSNPNSRTSVERAIEETLRKSGADGRLDVKALVNDVCYRIAVMERAGEPFQTVGNLPRTEEITWMIKHFAPHNEAMTLFGEGGSGKSYLALAMALSVFTGKTFVPGFPPLDSGPTLYLDWEAGPARLDQRVKRLCAGMGMAPVDLPYRRCAGALADQVEEVLRYCQSEKIVMVVIDSVEMAMAARGRDEGDINEPVKRLHAAARLFKCAAILVDHVSKEGLRNKGKREPYGGIYKINLARMVWELRSVSESNSGILRLALHNTKRNDDGPTLPTTGLQLTFGENSAKYENSTVEGEALGAGLKNHERISLVLRESPMMVKAIALRTGMSEDTVRATLSQNKGRFVKAADGRWGNAESRYEEEDVIPF